MRKSPRRSAVSRSARDAVPLELYQHARRQLLGNKPMLGRAGQGGSAAELLSAGELAALESVGLSAAPWTEGHSRDPLADDALLDPLKHAAHALGYALL